MQISELDLDSPEDVRTYLVTRSKLADKYQKGIRLDNDVVHLNKMRKMRTWMVDSGDLGYISVEVTEATHGEIMIELDTDNQRRRDSAYGEILSRVEHLPETLVLYWIDNPPRKTYLDWVLDIGGKIVQREHYNQLQISEANWKYISDVTKSFDLDYQTTVIHSDRLFARYLEDDEFSDQMAEFKSLAHAGVPSGESTQLPKKYTGDDLRSRARARMGREEYSFFLTLTMDGDTIVGSSKLNLHGDTGHNGMTAVRPEYRGKGIATYMKAVMLEFVRDNLNLSRIFTDNAEDNYPILKLNQNLGFKKIAEKVKIEIPTV